MKKMLVLLAIAIVFGATASKRVDMTEYTTCFNCGKTEIVVNETGKLVKNHQHFDRCMRTICDDCANADGIDNLTIHEGGNWAYE